MFGSGAKAATSELPVESVVRVRKVERIEANNVATKPPATATTRSLTVKIAKPPAMATTRSITVKIAKPPATAKAKMARSLTVQVVRVGDVDENTDGFFSVPIAHN